MSSPTDEIAADERTELLERRARIIRSRLLRVVDTLDARRHHIAEVVVHAKLRAKSAALSLIGIGAHFGASLFAVVPRVGGAQAPRSRQASEPRRSTVVRPSRLRHDHDLRHHLRGLGGREASDQESRRRASCPRVAPRAARRSGTIHRRLSYAASSGAVTPRASGRLRACSGGGSGARSRCDHRVDFRMVSRAFGK